MGRGYLHERARRGDPSNFQQSPARIPQMLQDVRADDALEAFIGEWPGKLVEVMNDIRLCLRVEIHADRIGNSDQATTNIQNGWE